MPNCLKKSGEVIKLVGMSELMLMSIAGIVVIDLLVILSALSGNNDNENENTFLTWYLLSTMNSSGDVDHDPTSLLFVSPVVTGAAIGLAFWMKKPELGLGLLYAFAAGVGTTVTGCIVSKLGDAIENCSVPTLPTIGFFGSTAVRTPPIPSSIPPHGLDVIDGVGVAMV